MFCLNCSKLYFLYTSIKKCLRCQSPTLYNISVICENCSNKDNSCSVCLKKANSTIYYKKNRGCKSCGG